MASLQKITRKTGVAWRIRYSLKGVRQKPYYLPIHITAEEAKIIKHEIELAVAKHDAGREPFRLPGDNQPVLTLSQYFNWFFDHYKTAHRTGRPPKPGTIAAYNESFRHLLTAVGNIQISELPTKIQRFEIYLSDRRANTRSKWIRCLRSAFNFGVKKQILQSNPFLELIITKERLTPSFYFPSDMERLFHYIQSDNRVIAYMILRYAAPRLSELMGIEKKDIYLSEEFIRIRKAKTEEHFKPLHPILKNFLILIWDQLPDAGPIITCTYHSISQGFKRAQHKAGLTRRGATHIFRHSLATNVESIEDAKYILGHESVTTSEIYRHIIDKKMKDRFKHQEL